MSNMGDLHRRMPFTHWTMLIATLAIAGIFPFAGFFSKDEILSSAFESHHYGIWAVGLVGALLTAFYMFRLYILTFRGTPRYAEAGEHGAAHGPDAGHGAH